MSAPRAIADIDAARLILLIGTNPRLEAPVLNARIRKAWLHGATVGLIGEAADLTYGYEQHRRRPRGAAPRSSTRTRDGSERDVPSW